MKSKTIALSVATLASVSLLVACAPAAQQQNQQPAQQTQQSNQNQQSDQQNQQSNQQNTNNSNNNQAAPAQNAPVAQPENIDGTYQGQDDHDQITLTVTGKQEHGQN